MACFFFFSLSRGNGCGRQDTGKKGIAGQGRASRSLCFCFCFHISSLFVCLSLWYYSPFFPLCLPFLFLLLFFFCTYWYVVLLFLFLTFFCFCILSSFLSSSSFCLCLFYFFFCFFYRLSTVFVSRNVHCLIISFPFSFSFCTYLAHSHMVYGCVAMTLDFISSVKISTIHSKPTHKTFELNLPAVLQPSDNLKPEVEENVFAKYFFY